MGFDSKPKDLVDDAYSELGYAVHNVVHWVQLKTGFTEVEGCEALKNPLDKNAIAIATQISKQEQSSS